VAVLHINKNNAAGSSKRQYTPALNQCILFSHIVIDKHLYDMKEATVANARWKRV